MPPDYDDDDIVEDYEEVSTDSGVRRVASAQGGPVKRPANGRPATSAVPALPDEEGQAQKGKISKKSAKLIWIVCIAVTVLGVGAVLTDILLDPLGRHKGGEGGSTGQANAAPPPRNTQPRQNLSPRQKLENEFRGDAIAQLKALDSTKAWDFYWTSALEFEDAYDKAKALKNTEGVAQADLEEGWAIAIKHYYKAKYAAEIFRFRFDEGEISKEFYPIDLNEPEAAAELLDAHLKDPRARKYQAACSKIDAKSSIINKFKTDILRYDQTASKVHESPEWAEKHFGAFQAKWNAATSKEPQFDPADLEFVNQPDYKADEVKMWQAYLKNKEG